MKQFWNSNAYTPINDEDSESAKFLPPSSDTSPSHDKLKSNLSKYVQWLLHILLIISYFILWINLKPTIIYKEGFDVPADTPIEYETLQFFDGNGNYSEYYGPSTPKTDAAWGRLLKNGPGMVWIDDGTASKLRQPTERVRDGGPGYIGNLEMFHQLHCLNRIRKLFYNHTREDMNDESEELRNPHTDHCFEYLRQVLMCHGDVGIMSMDWDENHHAYTAKFNIWKQCRKFDLIVDWMEEHQTTTWKPT